MATDEIESIEDGDMVNTYTLTLDPNGGFIEHEFHDDGRIQRRYTTEPMTVQVQFGKTVPGISNISSNTVRPGYVFGGWVKLDAGFWAEMPNTYPYKEQTKLTPSTIWIWNHNATFSAKWFPNEANIRWIANGGAWNDGSTENTTTTKYGAVIGNINWFKNQPTMIGQTFIGWFTRPERGTQITEYSQVEGDKAYYAQWQDKYCTITFKDENDNEIETLSVKYGYDLTFPKRSKLGYDFKGWVDDSGTEHQTDESLFVTNDITFKAQFEPTTYHITYNWDGKGEGTMPEGYWTTYNIESEEYELKEPTRTGYKFNGWKLNGKTVTTIGARSTGNRTFVSKGWTPREYNVTFDSCGGIPLEPTQTTIHYDDIVSLPEVPVKPESDGKKYTFIGWFTPKDDGVEVKDGDIWKKAENTTCYAHWKETIIQYEIKYDGNGATSGIMRNSIHKNGVKKSLTPNAYAKEYTITYVDIKASPDEDSRESRDLKFLGWSKVRNGDVIYQDQEVVVDVSEIDTGDTAILYAKWEASTTAVLNHPGHEGYNLDGWYNANDEDVVYLTKRNGDNWTDINDLQSGDNNKWYVNGEEKIPGNNDFAIVGEINNQIKFFYQDRNWKQFTKIGDPGDEITLTNNIVVYAKWTPQTRTVVFNAMGGTTSQPILTIPYGGHIGENLPIAQKDGYKFIGWFTEPENGQGVEIDSATPITVNTTFYAHWEINTTTITFFGNGGFVK